MLKSVLKKPCLPPASNGRRVTFCETVEIYTTEKLSAPLVDTSSTQFEFSLEDLAEEWDPFASKCLILSWQDNEEDSDAFSSRQLETPEDFLVHKVVYDSADLKEMDTPTEHDDVTSGNEQESDSQPFIVHQVERSEDDDETDETSSDSDAAEKSSDDSPPIKETKNLNEKICELSMRNIEQHNKLLETEMLTCCEDSAKSVVPEEDIIPTIKDIGLSPPLKELGIDKLIAQSADNWLVNLDISPLSSVQETDSESNLSSEDTMIMMTSEECEKNEKRIKESFQKFELLKNLKSKEIVLEESLEMEGHNEIEFTRDDTFVTPRAGIKASSSENSSNSHKVIEVGKTQEVEETNSGTQSLVPVRKVSLSSDGLLEVLGDDQSPYIGNQQTVSYPRRDSTISLDTSLSDVEIPQDVREWKIDIGKTVSDNQADFSPDLLLDSCMTHDVELESSQPWTQHTIEMNDTAIRSERRRSEPSPMPENDCTKPDELELFVNQCTERVERIRKRYSLNEGTLWSPHRGIRPRFGSTAEIVQQIQDTQQPVYVNSHYSWPNYMSLEHESAPLNASFCSSSLPTDFRSYPPDVVCNTMPQRQCINNDVDDKIKNVTNYQPASKPCSDIPTPFLFTFQERGTPEGASPPKLSSESLYETEAHSDSIVYYSMKV